jgi:hypothetical protein
MLLLNVFYVNVIVIQPCKTEINLMKNLPEKTNQNVGK